MRGERPGRLKSTAATRSAASASASEPSPSAAVSAAAVAPPALAACASSSTVVGSAHQPSLFQRRTAASGSRAKSAALAARAALRARAACSNRHASGAGADGACSLCSSGASHARSRHASS